jgi:SAM-dependent methyltransferase
MHAMTKQSETDQNTKGMLLRAALLQGVSALLVGAVAWWMNLSLGAWIVLTALLAGLLSYQSELPRWWLIIHILFLPAMAMVYSLGLPAWVFLLAFVFLFAVYGGVFSSRVPLYLSGLPACQALENLMPVEKNFYFLDIGCGTGSVLCYLDKRFPFGMFHGVETAPIPFVISWVRSKLNKAQFQVRYQNMWQVDLAPYDVVYAFLSPQPMPDLWQKVQREMQPGSIFISNSFTVPDVEPDEVVELNSGRATALFVWRIKDNDQETVA